MTINELKAIKAVFDGINQGISNPILINTAYSYLPGKIDGAPIRAKIQAISRFMMLSYAEVLKQVQQEVDNKHMEIINKQVEVIEDSIGTIENRSKYSHQESDEILLMDSFLTVDERENLSDNTSGTELILERDGKKRRQSRKAKR